MKKYVDVDLLKNEICKNKIMSRELIAQRILHIIDEQPAADVAEVKSGAWENMSEIGSAYVNTYRCSACGTTFWIDESPEDANYNYCPNCGAKMGKGQEC